MILRLKKELFDVIKFKYTVEIDGREKNIYLKKDLKGCVTVNSDEFEHHFKIQLTRFFHNKEKDGTVTKRTSGDFAIDGFESGSINYCTKKGSNFLNGIYFWTFETDGQEYIAYEVGFGRKGIYLCIWKNNQLIAVVSKDVHSKHFGSGYTLYAENFVPMEMLCVCSVFWDLTRYSQNDSVEEYHTLNTWQKELKNKFDPTFIERIKALENNNG